MNAIEATVMHRAAKCQAEGGTFSPLLRYSVEACERACKAGHMERVDYPTYRVTDEGMAALEADALASFDRLWPGAGVHLLVVHGWLIKRSAWPSPVDSIRFAISNGGRSVLVDVVKDHAKDEPTTSAVREALAALESMLGVE